ncbi:MAG: cell division protein FtsZ, partial [Dehalococcoidales bacterium]|nr:cell division protein FtsZ [Dehalococcoidales bacterium]
GMGGGTGTGSAPIAAAIAKQTGALTIGIVTRPFGFEGAHRQKTALEGITNMLDKVDTLIIIPNDRLFALCDAKTTVDAAFKMADDVLKNGVEAIAQVINVPGMINLDFADVRTIMKDAGPAWMSIGRGAGPNRAVDAAKAALASPILDVAIQGAKSVLYNVMGGNNLTLHEVNQAAEIIKKAMDPDANIIFGVAHDESLQNEVKITLVATGFMTQIGPSASETRTKELSDLLKGLKSGDELDIPTFLRRPKFGMRRTIPPKAESPTKDLASRN